MMYLLVKQNSKGKKHKNKLPKERKKNSPQMRDDIAYNMV